MSSAVVFYLLAGTALTVSAVKSRDKTISALKKSWKAFLNILPQFVGIILTVGIMLALLSPEVISSLIGDASGFLGVLGASLIGAVTLIPGFIAFPTAALLLQSGAGLMQIAAFISSLMMVGIMTMPVEVEYFGRKASLMRNIIAYLFSLIAAVIIGAVVS